MDLSAIGWREAVIAVAVVVAAFVGWGMLRLLLLKARVPDPHAWKRAGPSFADEQYRAAVDAELRGLRAELAALRTEVGTLRASRSAAPQYDEALGLAARGEDAAAIAERCGISVAEAELVRALGRRNTENRGGADGG